MIFLKSAAFYIKRYWHSVLCLLCAFIILVFSLAVPVYALDFSDIDFDEINSYLSDYGVSSWTDVSDDVRALADAYLTYFKSFGSSDMFTTCFDIPLSWVKLISDTNPVLYVGKRIYYLDSDGQLNVYYHSSSHSGYGGGGGINRHVSSASDFSFTASELREAISDYNSRYCPKSTNEVISWRTNRFYSGTTSNSYSYIPLAFRANSCFCDNDNWVTDVYLVPFYTDDTGNYYGTYQYHFYVKFDKDEDGNYILDDNGQRVAYIMVDYWNMSVTDSDVYTETLTGDYYNYPYIAIPSIIRATEFDMWRWTNLSDYVSFSANVKNSRYFNLTQIGDMNFNEYISDDYLSTINVEKSSCTYLGRTVDSHDTDCGSHCDIGYYCSNKPIKMDLSDIDWSQFDDTDIITPTDGSIYDYTITDFDTGHSTTIGQYVINNYYYGDGDSSSGGGSSAGDVNVNVDVDVNFNESMPVNVDLDNYLEKTPEQAKPVTQFITIFFDFLPAELLGLICLGVTVAIILRIWGR